MDFGSKKNISSNGLAEFIGRDSAQIRKDFSYFGAFGTRGVGYDTQKLITQISKILKLNGQRKAILIGVGNLGRAILAYAGFGIYGFNIEMAFDSDRKKIGKKVNGIPIRDIAKLPIIKKVKMELAILAVPGDEANQVAEALVNNGIRGILNFAPCYIEVPRNVKVISIDIALDMARLPYYIPNSKTQNDK